MFKYTPSYPRPRYQEGYPQPFDIGYTKLSIGEYITVQCVCLNRNFPDHQFGSCDYSIDC